MFPVEIPYNINNIDIFTVFEVGEESQFYLFVLYSNDTKTYSVYLISYLDMEKIPKSPLNLMNIDIFYLIDTFIELPLEISSSILPQFEFSEENYGFND